MSPRLRRVLRLSGLAVHLAVGAALVKLVYPRAQRATRMRIRAWWCRCVLRLLGVELQVFGTVPPGCHLIAANHVSWLDVFAIAARFPCWFVSKDDTRSWPFLGWMAVANETLFLRRASARAAWRMNVEIRARLDAQQPVVVFPEGTTTDGTRVLDFYPALFQPSVDCARTVLPLAIRYRDAAARPATAVAYVNDDPLWTSLKALLEAPRTEAHLVLGEPLDAAGWKRRDLARHTCGAIRELQRVPASVHRRGSWWRRAAPNHGSPPAPVARFAGDRN